MALPFAGEAVALASAFFYAAGAVAIAKGAQTRADDGGGALLSVVVTGAMAGGLWLVLGPPLPPGGAEVWRGVLLFALAGVLANLIGRLLMFRSVALAGAIETGVLRRLISVFAAALAVALLGERITGPVALGVALIFAAVAVTVLRRGVPGGTGAGRALGRALGVGSAAGYGGAYVARKAALGGLPDPLIGTLIGAVAGGLSYGVLALRRGPRLARRWPSGWQVAAAALISLGQIAQFFALSLTTVTAVAVIGACEMFFSAWLAAAVLRTEPWPGPVFLLSSTLALAGAAAIAFG
ncbi:DMT family transporter [Jannaschia formosa]|uniref:DMT family transporter n=1 Tax=Jannaschia formosa TaxID=2259592 RepID=UPI000E1B9234|nr:DMT family transporter [Jannaschia formosa]TFL18825.1 EamA family transporter [Jannaschia formosa]